ncbi:MAG: hypothetical protein GWP63_17450 [Haliea sp.]|nr:hypothetical protein [Haliea sp.]
MNEISLTDLGNLGEFVGAIAVVASLIYVGIQLRQNTAAIKITTAQAFTDTWNVFFRGLRGTSHLKEGELVQFYAFLSQAFTTYQSFFIQRQKGVVDEGSWTSYVQAIIDLMSSKGVREYWEFRHHWYTEEFQDYVNSASTKQSTHTMYPGLPEANL